MRRMDEFLKEMLEEGYETVRFPDGRALRLPDYVEQLRDNEKASMDVMYSQDERLAMHVFERFHGEVLFEVHLPDDEKIFVNAYAVTRHYGGPEEGGWWVNLYECVEVVETTPLMAEGVVKQLEEKWTSKDYGDIYSVLGGVKHVVYSERKPKQSEDMEIPYYC